MSEILTFLRQLEQNNNREWFNDHKSDYQQAREQFELILNQVIADLSRVDPGIRGQKAADAVYRIYRDIRFSPDKTPYKNNFGAHLSRGGKNSGGPGYYVNVQPGACFLSGGIYMPDKEKLKAIRKEIYLFPEDFSALIENTTFKKSFSFFQEDKLKRPPVGFPEDFPLIDYLKFKHYCPWLPISDEWFDMPDLPARMVAVFEQFKPFNDFIHRAIEG